jgi:hypothetical protein
MNQFFDFILASPLFDPLAEYIVANTKITHDRRTGKTFGWPMHLRVFSRKTGVGIGRPHSDNSGGLNGSMQHLPKVLS